MHIRLARARFGAIARFLSLVVVCGLLPLAGLAAEPEAAVADAGKRFATVWKIRGEVSAQAGGGAKERLLREGDVVYVGERIRAASSAEAVLKTDDAGAVAIRPGAELLAERFSARGDASDNVTLRLITGSLRVISGWIARTNRSGNRIVTPSATIGIRGTDHEPYVLTAELAKSKPYKPGTYDKVNRGGTTIDVKGESLDVDAGKVGFARLVTVKQRALMTILLPVLLDKVPDFYVPGEFDAELERFSQTADEQAAAELERKRGGAATAECVPSDIAKAWVDRLDAAVTRGDAAAIVAMFAPDATVRAIVIGKDGGTSTIDLDRDELAQSTLAAVKELKGYQHRRVSLDAWPDPAGACERIGLKSVVIEQGTQSGKRFRFESLETYTLERQAGNWLATKAETSQR